MKRAVFKGLSTVLICAVLLGLGGCSRQQPAQGDWHLWSTYNTTKVIQQASRNDSYTQLPAQLSVQMMKYEYEGAQLIITAGQEVSYQLSAGVLQNDKGHIFPAENIKIYHQKYQTIASNFNGDNAFQSGDSIPDMLLPMDIAVAYGENTVAAGTNQGITVEFFSQDVPAGIYTGSFTLTLNGEATPIPVQVEVWDIRYEGRREFQSCFILYRDELFISEFRCDDQLVDTYVDMLLDYKINTYVIQDTTPEQYIAQVQRLFENSSYNSIPIPCRFPWDYATYKDGEITPAAQEAANYIKALAKASTPEKDYLAYAYLYLGFLDEADVIDGRQAPSEAFLKDGGEYQQLLQLVISQLRIEGWLEAQSPEFSRQIQTEILQLPAVFTNVNYVPEWVGTLNATFCPYLSVYQDTAVLNRYQQAAADRSFGNLWLYTCCGPTDPYPTFHIDDGTLDKRVCGWMMKAYGITGYLYYKVNNYAYLMSKPDQTYMDVYHTPARYFDVNGDGFLLYPGRYYGSDQPFPTLRLAAYRDGMDEYDMLCIYESLLKEQGKKPADFSLYVADLYRSLFSGMVANQDPETFYQVREELARRILSLQNDGMLLMDPAKAEQVRLTDFPEGKQEITIRSQYMDSGEEIGSKTKMFTPAYTLPVDNSQDAHTLSFAYKNTGSQDISMQIIVTAGGKSFPVGTSFCGTGKAQKVRIPIPEELGAITEIRLEFENVQVGTDGQVILIPDRVFTVSNFYLIKGDGK